MYEWKGWKKSALWNVRLDAALESAKDRDE